MLAVAAWLCLLGGLFFHHSSEPVILGRFSRTYALTLLVLLLLAPALFLAVRALFSPSVVTRADGSQFTVGPVPKVAVFLLSTLFAFGLAQLAFPKRPRYEYRRHPFLQAVPLPNAAKGVNSRGFRGGEPAVPKPARLLRIALLGGSTFFDPNLEYEETFGRQLERRLGAALDGRRVEVQCGAMPGYNSEHSLIRYATDVADLEPDIVLVMHAVNDLHVCTAPFSVFRRDYGHYEGLGEQHLHPGFRDRTRLVDSVRFFFRYVLFSDYRRPDDVRVNDVTPDPGPLVRNLRSIITLGRGRGQTVVLCTQPHRFRLDLPESDRLRGEASLRNFFNGEPLPGFVWFSRSMALFNDKIRTLGAEERLAVLDLQRDVPPTSALFDDDLHVTAKGAQLEADLATKFLLENGLVR